MAAANKQAYGLNIFTDRSHLFDQLSSEGEDNFQGDTIMMESPDSGYRSPQDYIQATRAQIIYSTDEPYLEILEEPIDKFRFRYKSEMAGTHGSLTGVNSDRARRQTYPTVVLRNYPDKAIIRCSLYQCNREEENKPHAHRLVRKVDNTELDDPHEIEVGEENGHTACFQNMGIIHTAKKFLVPELIKKKTQLKKEEIHKLEGVIRKLTKREECMIENEATEESKVMDLNIVRLRFDAFYRNESGVMLRICKPVYSQCINNLKSALTGELKIVRMSRCTSTCRGGVEVFLLVEKVTKKNIEVRFFEEDENETEIWSDYGKFSEVDVHHQYAIVLKTPPYKDQNIEHDVKVFIQLIRKTDNSRSDPKCFTYTPALNTKIGAKRPRLDGSLSSISSSRSFMSTDIPKTIMSINALSNNLEKQSLSSDILSEDLNVKSDELEHMYTVAFPDLFDHIKDSPFSIDGPVKKITKKQRMEVDKISLQELELQYCQEVYKELYAFRKANQQESSAVKFLLHHFQNKSKQPSGNNPLHIIACNYNKETQIYLDFFLKEIHRNKQYSILNSVNNEKETPLHLAVSLNNKEVVEKLILAKANVNCKDTNGDTVLHLAVKNNNLPIIKLLFSYSADVAINEENHDGDAALHIAVRKGFYDIFVFLCKSRANVNIQHKNDGYTPIRMAIERADVKMVKYLLNFTNVDLTIRDYKDILPVQAAAVSRDCNKNEMQEIRRLLLEHMGKHGEPTELELDIKGEVDSSSEGGDDIESVQMEQIKTEEYDTEYLKQAYDSVKDFTPSVLEKLCRELDESGQWKNLAELLDLKQFEDTDFFQKEPTKNLLQLAVIKGESLYQIRDFLGNLGEFKCVRLMDNMVISRFTP